MTTSPSLADPAPAPAPAVETLTFPSEHIPHFAHHLPPPTDADAGTLHRSRPFVTLTFATSLDSSLALAPGIRTALSGPQSKAMTHFLRSRHAAILIGVGTAVADDPGLNCRIASAPSPRPIVLDPHCRWAVGLESKMMQLARSGQGLAPFVLHAAAATSDGPSAEQRVVLEQHGGKYIVVPATTTTGRVAGRFCWEDVLDALAREGLDSVMVEGGAAVINSLLAAPDNALVDSVIVTIAPTWLGQGGVVVSPPRTVGADGQPTAPVRLTDVSWCPLGEDIVLCGKLLR